MFQFFLLSLKQLQLCFNNTSAQKSIDRDALLNHNFVKQTQRMAIALQHISHYIESVYSGKRTGCLCGDVADLVLHCLHWIPVSLRW